MSTLKVQIGAELSELENALSQVSRKITDVGKNLESMGKTLSTRVTAPIVAFGALTVRSFGKQEDAERKLRAALQANGREVDSLFNRYNNFAKEMQKTTVIGDEVTLAMLQQAESLGLTSDSAERAVRNSIAMQSAFGVNAQSAIRYTAALEQGNATMLTRYIPTLRDIEDESERVAEAQRVLANAFQVSESEAQGTTGQLIQLKNAVGDMMETIGAVVAEAILPFVRRLKELAESAQQLNPDLIKLGVGIAGITAAVGPLLIILGKLASALAFVLSPIILKVSALGALGLAFVYVIRNLDAFKNAIPGLTFLIDQAIRSITFQTEMLKRLGDAFKNIASIFKSASDEVDNFEDSLPDEKTATGFESFSDFVKGTLSDLGGFIRDFTQDLTGLDLSSKFVIDSAEVKESVDETEKAMGRVALAYESAADRASAALSRMEIRTVEGVKGSSESLNGFADITDELAARINFALVDMTESFFTSLANIAFAGGGLSNVARGLLSTLADLAIQMGRIILSAGIGIEALKISLSSFTGVGAIAAGAALIAIGSAAKAALSSVGSSAGSTGSANFEPFARDVQSGGQVTFRIQGNELIGVLDNTIAGQSRAVRRTPINV